MKKQKSLILPFSPQQSKKQLIGRIFGAQPHEKTYNGRIIFYKGDRR